MKAARGSAAAGILAEVDLFTGAEAPSSPPSQDECVPPVCSGVKKQKMKLVHLYYLPVRIQTKTHL